MALRIYQVFHLLVTGTIVILLSTFFASGGIGENFTDNPFPYPAWLLPIAVWVIGLIFVFNKKTAKYGLIISALPVLFYIVLYIMVLSALNKFQ